MSDSVKKYFEQQEENTLLRRRENLHLQLKKRWFTWRKRPSRS